MKGIAVVGASERNVFAVNVVKNLTAYDYNGPIWPINPKYAELFGLTCYPSIEELPGEAGVAVVAVSTAQSRAVVKSAVAAGIPEIIVITDGFAEAGRQDLQQELLDELEGSSSRLYGPNCLGMFDVAANVCAMTAPVPTTLEPGPVSFISQSGATLSTFMDASVQEGFGLDWCLSVGNGADVDLARALDIAISRPTTKVVCLYAESLGHDPTLFGRALDKARELDKWVLLLKVGVSDLGSRIALSHTASMVGQDNLVGSFLERHGAVRTDSLEELVRLAGICSITDRNSSGGVAIVGSSGGMALMASDAAARYGLHLAKFTDETVTFIKETATPESFIDNPFDLVRAGNIPGGPNAIWNRVYDDPNVALVLAPWVGTYPDPDAGVGWPVEMITDFKDMGEAHRKSTVACSLAVQTWTPFAERLRDTPSDYYLFVRGLDTTLKALARIFPVPLAVAATHGHGHGQSSEANIEAGLLSEERARDILQGCELPLVRGRTFASPDVMDLSDMAFPVVVKIAAEGVNHKVSIGGVRIGLLTADDAVAAGRDILSAVRSAGIKESSIQGVRVEEMVRGPELLVGLQRDPGLGPHLTLGIGGSLTEAAAVTSTVMAPVSRDRIVAELQRLKLWKAFGRNGDAVADMLVDLSARFTDGELAKLRTVELNPVIVTSRGPEIADVLIVE